MKRPTRQTRCPTCHRIERRSSQANARYWLLMHLISERVRPMNGIAETSFAPDVWHEYFKSRFLGCKEFRLPNGKTLQIPRSSADLDTAEFNDFQTQVEAWAAERGVYLADMAAA